MTEEVKSVKKKDGPPRRRLQLSVPERNYNQLLEMKKALDVKTLTKVVRRALRLLSRYMLYRSRGWSVILRSPRGEELPLDPEDNL